MSDQTAVYTSHHLIVIIGLQLRYFDEEYKLSNVLRYVKEVGSVLTKYERRRKMATTKLRIKLASYDTGLLENVVSRILDTATKSGCKVSGPVPLPTKKEVVTIIRATHNYKYSREQFESRTHFRLIDVFAPNAKAVDALLKMNVPAGVDIKVEL